MKINEIRPLDGDFTSVMAPIALKYEKLYYLGKLPEKRLPTVAIVGSRKPTKYGEENAYKFAYELAKRGFVIISGLALGIDAMAHRGALDAGGITLAVLGNGVGDITPHSNRALGERIVEQGGAIISEYEPDEPPVAAYFLERNRIVSGLSDAVIVVEAASRSGTLSTAAHAIGQGRYVFAVPGNINSPMSVGCNGLLKQGAFVLTDVKDVLEVLAPAKLEQTELGVLGDNEVEDKILKLIRRGVRDGEFMIAELGIEPSEFNQVVTMMELKSKIRSLGANKWTV